MIQGFFIKEANKNKIYPNLNVCADEKTVARECLRELVIIRQPIVVFYALRKTWRGKQGMRGERRLMTHEKQPAQLILLLFLRLGNLTFVPK